MTTKPTKTILITGASSGIGRDAAFALARAGHHVIAAARRLPALEALRDAVREATLDASGNVADDRHGKVTPLQLDLDDPVSIAAAAASIDSLTDGRGLDVLVNNAGFATAGALAELPDAALRAQFETNVFGLMALTRAVIPPMLARGAGLVVNVSSVSGRIPAPVLGAYHASKYALEALSDALRMELAAFGVRLAIVEPGTIRTGFAARVFAESASARVFAETTSAAGASRYSTVYDRAAELEARFDAMAGDTGPVVRAILHAVHARRPRIRYVAPRRFMLLIALLRILPTCWTDAAMRKMFGLTRAQLALGPMPQLD